MSKPPLSMRIHFNTDKTSFANNLLLVAMVVGMLNIDSFESDGCSGHHRYEAVHRIELYINEGTSAPEFHVLCVSEDLPENDVVKDHTLKSYFYTTSYSAVLLVQSKTPQVNTRPFYSSYNHIRLSNIPHQNSDEDPAPILPFDVA